MRRLDFKSVLIGFLGATVVALSINATSEKAPASAIYEFSDKGEKDILRFNKVTGEIESVNIRDEVVTEYYKLSISGSLSIY